jgi:hypothetical protein
VSVAEPRQVTASFRLTLPEELLDEEKSVAVHFGTKSEECGGLVCY